MKAIFRWELSLVAAALLALGFLVSAPIGTTYAEVTDVAFTLDAAPDNAIVDVVVIAVDDDPALPAPGLIRIEVRNGAPGGPQDGDSVLSIVSCTIAGGPAVTCTDLDADPQVIEFDTSLLDGDTTQDTLTLNLHLDMQCDDAVDDNEVLYVVGMQDDTISVDQEDSIFCEAGDTPNVTISKEDEDGVNNSDGPFSFTVTSSNGGFCTEMAFVLLTGQDNDLFCAYPAIYTISETPLAGWELTGVTCDSAFTVILSGGAIVGVRFTISDASTINCTFTNAPVTAGTGTIVIVKDTVPNDGTDFAFTSNITGTCSTDPTPATFSLDDDADVTLPNTETCTGVTPGSYTVTETANVLYTTTVSCDDSNSTDANPSTIVLAASETVTCTFTNTLIVAGTGIVHIIKDTVPNSSQDFSFISDLAGSCTTDASPASFILDDDADVIRSNTETCTNVTPGTYTVTETGPAGYDVVVSCDDSDSFDSGSEATIVLDADEEVTCYFTNTPVSTSDNLTLTVEKDSEVDSTSDVFDFDIDDSDTFGGCNDSSFVNLNPGDDDFTDCTVADGDTIIISEINIPSGWTLADITCRDLDIVGGRGTNWDYSINLGADEVTVEILDITGFGPNAEIICNFDNDPGVGTGNITIVKDATGGTGSEDFDFDVVATGTQDCEGSFTLSDGDSNALDCEVDVTYTITENVQSGWDLTQISCVRDGGLASSAVVVQLSSDRVLITLGDTNDSVECTFHNTKTTTTTGVPARTQAVATLATLGCNASELVNITVVDINGLAVANGTPVTVTASIGTVTPAVTQTSAGGAVVLYTAPASTGGVAILTAIAGGIVGQTQIVINCAPTPTPTTPPPPPPPPPPAADTGAGVIRPPSTGDAGLADSSGFGWQLSALALLAVSLTVAGVTLVARRAV